MASQSNREAQNAATAELHCSFIFAVLDVISAELVAIENIIDLQLGASASGANVAMLEEGSHQIQRHAP